MSDTDLLNTAFIETSFFEDDPSTIINNTTSYWKFTNSYIVHNLSEALSFELIKDLDIGSWILWVYKDPETQVSLNAITIKTSDCLVNHTNFIFDFYNKNEEVIEVYKTYERKLISNKSYSTMKEFLEKLNNIYGLDLDKQVIYEND
jgi:hypothetical protein